MNKPNGRAYIQQKLEQIKNHQGVKRYGINTAWLMGEKILRMFVGLFVGVWVARYLGPEQYGLLSYAQSFVFLFTTFATLGLDSIVVRELVKDDGQRDVLLGTSFALKLVGAFAILPILWVAVQFTSNDSYTNYIIFITALATVFQSFNVIDFYYQSTVMSKYVALANTITLCISSLIKVFLIVNHAPLMAFAWMAVFDSIVFAIGLVYFYLVKTKYKLSGWKFNQGVAKQLLKDSYPLIISSVMVTLYMKIDQVMIKEMLDNNAVGQYAAAVRISEAWYFIPMALCNSLFPAIINAKKISQELYVYRLKQLLMLMVMLGLSVAIFTTFTSHLIIRILYGNQYYEAADILSLHIWSGIFVGIGLVSGRWVVNENLLKNAMLRTTIAGFLNIILNLIFIPKYGVLGSAIATFLAYFYVNYLSMAFYQSTREFFIYQTKALFFRR